MSVSSSGGQRPPFSQYTLIASSGLPLVSGAITKPTSPELAGHGHQELAPGLDHLCFRARSREDVDELYPFVEEIGAELVRAPEQGPWAPGYYSVSFRDPEGIRLEVNHVPGKGVLAAGASFAAAPDHPLQGTRQ